MINSEVVVCVNACRVRDGVLLQAAFGAPIGGVLFSMEEACTHWSRKVQQPFHMHRTPFQLLMTLRVYCEIRDMLAGCLAVLHMHNSGSADRDAAEPRVSTPHTQPV